MPKILDIFQLQLVSQILIKKTESEYHYLCSNHFEWSKANLHKYDYGHHQYKTAVDKVQFQFYISTIMVAWP